MNGHKIRNKLNLNTFYDYCTYYIAKKLSYRYDLYECVNFCIERMLRPPTKIRKDDGRSPLKILGPYVYTNKMPSDKGHLQYLKIFLSYTRLKFINQEKKWLDYEKLDINSTENNYDKR